MGTASILAHFETVVLVSAFPGDGKLLGLFVVDGQSAVGYFVHQLPRVAYETLAIDFPRHGTAIFICLCVVASSELVFAGSAQYGASEFYVPYAILFRIRCPFRIVVSVE